jgi:hypothetical protein
MQTGSSGEINRVRCAMFRRKIKRFTHAQSPNIWATRQKNAIINYYLKRRRFWANIQKIKSHGGR